MAQKQTKSPPPYATFPTFINFINKLRETTTPSRIDPSMFGNASGSLIYSIISSLKSLSLIDENGTPQPTLKALVKASDEERKPLFEKIIRAGYPSFWNGSIDLASTTSGQFDDHLRDEFQINGSTIDKVAAFFIAAANYLDIPLSPHLKARKPIATSSASKKSSKQRKKAEGEEASPNNGGAPSIPPAATSDHTKPLEYQLIDLMQAPDIDDDVKKSIWSLVQYLMARKAKSGQESSA